MPVHPTAQIHVYALRASVHVPPLLQGLLEHSLKSINVERNLKECKYILRKPFHVLRNIYLHSFKIIFVDELSEHKLIKMRDANCMMVSWVERLSVLLNLLGKIYHDSPQKGQGMRSFYAFHPVSQTKPLNKQFISRLFESLWTGNTLPNCTNGYTNAT